MAKKDLLAKAQAAGLVAEDVEEDAFTEAELREMLDPDKPAHKGSLSSSEPLVAPDGHVNLSQEDIDARDS